MSRACCRRNLPQVSFRQLKKLPIGATTSSGYAATVLDLPLTQSRELPETSPAEAVASWPRVDSDALCFRVPEHWRSSVGCNPHAAVAAREVLRWLTSLGCSDAEIAHAERFDIAGYMGIAFPLAPAERAVFVAKYISLWLLWDDVHVESRQFRWCLEDSSLGADAPPMSFSRFDRGWWTLFRELSQRRSPSWVERLSASMRHWDEVAAAEATMFAEYTAQATLPAFEVQLELRAISIGMLPTILLIEDVLDCELSESFHQQHAVQRLESLAGVLVGIGNDVFGFGKDLTEGLPNLATNLILDGELSALGAVARLIAMHDEGVNEFDRIAHAARETEPQCAEWLRYLRFASLGFTIWESQAPRYATHKVLVGRQVMEPRLRFVDGDAA